MRRTMTILAVTAALTGVAVPATPPPSAGLPTTRPGPGAPEPATGFRAPLAGPFGVVRGFVPPETDFGPGHRGVDMSARPTTPVLAAGDGVVVYAGPLADRGVISIEHPGGLRTTYEPVRPEVSEGQRVTRGQRIGHLAPGHPECKARRPGDCLHWGAKRGNEYVNPLRLLGRGAVRLLPWTPVLRS